MWASLATRDKLPHYAVLITRAVPTVHWFQNQHVSCGTDFLKGWRQIAQSATTLSINLILEHTLKESEVGTRIVL